MSLDVRLLQMFAVMKTAKLASVEINSECFKSIMTITKTKKEQNRDNEEDNSKTLHLSRVKGSSQLLSEGKRKLIAHSHRD